MNDQLPQASLHLGIVAGLIHDPLEEFRKGREHLLMLPEEGSQFHADIVNNVNRGFRDLPGKNLAGGWTNEGDNDLRGMKPGRLSVGEIEFTILDPSVNGNKSVIALRNQDPAFITETVVAMGRELCDWIYLLNAVGFSDRLQAGLMTLRYEDGSAAVVPVETDNHVSQWWGKGNAAIAEGILIPVNASNPGKETVSLYACGIRNPNPQRLLKEIVFSTDTDPENHSAWLILAVVTNCGKNLLPGQHEVRITADLNAAAGTIRKLHGANIGAPIYMNRLREITSGYLKDLEIPITRMHDCPWDNAGMKLIDIHQIFPLFHADHHDPANYFFKQTDDFIANCLAYGSKVYYRLGESIEHSEKSYFTHPPTDYDKWAEICVNIIKHYNEGWADGFTHQIEYWEIWNEPDLGKQLWTGTYEDYIRLYITASKTIKARFPEIKVGGPGLVTLSRVELAETFLAECRKHEAPLDFFSWHKYGSNVDAIVKEPAFVKQLLIKHGYPEAELHLNEWHYHIGGWQHLTGPHAIENQREWSGVNGAAYLCAVLSGWQDSPLDMGHYYTSSTTGLFGLFDIFGTPNKCYFGMKSFTAMTHYSRRFAVEAVEGNRVWTLGGTDAEGNAAILLSCSKGHQKQIKIQVENATLDPAKIKVRCVDVDKNLEPTDQFTVSGNTMTLEKPDGSIIYLIELGK